MAGDGSDPWAGGRLLLGEYRVERLLGMGGMGEVYLVRSRSTGQPFAVKRARPDDPGARRRMLAELRTWIDLPAHPHLTACHFFRTVADEVAIFAEYVEGGTLAEAIYDRKLTELGPILDIAIQIAWGLDAAHRRGVVHQDVKPGNVLVTATGAAKVTDFGLARLAATAAGPAAFGGAMSRSYCSPEQAALVAAGTGAGLTPHTDMWSWGLTVLEMFVGDPPCRYGGQLAAEVLESFIQKGGHEPGLPALPPLMVPALRKCFQQRPADRWGSMAEVAQVVRVAYKMATGSDYPRPEPPPFTPADSAGGFSRRTVGGASWDHPIIWRRRAFRAVGRNPDEAGEAAGAPAGSRKAQAVADLGPYDEAYRLLADFVGGGRRDLAPMLAQLCLAKATVHRAADDPPGAAALYGEAERLLASSRDAAHAPDLIRAILGQALVLRGSGRFPEAVAACDRALAVCERHGAPSDRRLGGEFVSACLDRGTALGAMGDHHAALAAFERAQLVCEDLIRTEGRDDFRTDLAAIFTGKYRVFRALGEPTAATAWLDRAIPLYEQLHREDAGPLAGVLGAAYQSKAILLSALGDPQTAAAYYDRAIALWEEAAESQDRPELAPEVAQACVNKAILARSSGNVPESLTLCDRAIATYERLTGPAGQQGLVPDLAWACREKADTLIGAGDAAAAVEAGARGLGLLEPLVADGERPDLAPDLARAHQTQARALRAAGATEPALACRQAAAILFDQLVREGGRWELAPDLIEAFRAMAGTLVALGRGREALEQLDRAVVVADWLVENRGQQNMRQEATDLRVARSELLMELGDPERARQELHEVLARLDTQDPDEATRRRALDRLERLW